MYTIAAIVNGVEYPIHNPKSRKLIVGDPWFEVGDNINGSAEFIVYPNHPFFDRVHKLTTEIVIRNDGSEEFRGRVLYEDEDFAGSKKVVCEGELAYLCDSIQRPKVYHNTSVSDYLADLLSNHNGQVEARKQFQLGLVTVVDSNDSLYRYSNWNSTRECLSEKLVERLGGHLVVRWENGVRYLDYLADSEFYHAANQKIEFGRNLLDFAKNADATDLATCIIPLGAKQEEETTGSEESSSDSNLDNRLTIESINNGVDYVFDATAVQEYGKIFKTVVNDDITTAAYLKSWGEEYLQSSQFERLVLEVKAIDLGLQDTVIQRFTLGHRIHCVSTPNGMDTWLPVASMRTYLMRMEENTLTLGASGTMRTYTSSNRNTTAELERSIAALPSKPEIVQDALSRAQTLFNTQLQNGYAHYLDNELVISDNATLSESTKMWRWGLGGLAYSSTGYNGTFRTAWTMDGAFVADFITAGTLSANVIGSRSITAEKIATSTITANEIAANTITAAKMNVSTLSAISANVGTLTAGVLQSSNYSSGVSGMKLDLTNGTADITGKITSSSGSIGGFTIGSSSIRKTATINNVLYDYFFQAADGNSLTNVFAVRRSSDNGQSWEYPFRVNYEGNVWAKNLRCASINEYQSDGNVYIYNALVSGGILLGCNCTGTTIFGPSEELLCYYSDDAADYLLRPGYSGENQGCRLGTGNHPFNYVQTKHLYVNGSQVTSDRKLKSHFQALGNGNQKSSRGLMNGFSEAFIYGLTPSAYYFSDKSALDEKLHFGFYAQDVHQLLSDLCPDYDFGVTNTFIKSGDADIPYNPKLDEHEDEDLRWYLSYTELLAPLVAVVQNQKIQIDSLEARLDAIKA